MRERRYSGTAHVDHGSTAFVFVGHNAFDAPTAFDTPAFDAPTAFDTPAFNAPTAFDELTGSHHDHWRCAVNIHS